MKTCTTRLESQERAMKGNKDMRREFSGKVFLSPVKLSERAEKHQSYTDLWNTNIETG